MSKRQLDVFLYGGTALMVTAFMAIVLATRVALGQPASQPVVVAPVAAGGAWAWFVANSGWLVPLAISVLSSLATGLSDYPKANGFVKVLRIVVAALGVCQFKNAPGTLKAPFTPPSKA